MAAARWRRLAAALLDGLIIMLLLIVAMAILMSVTGGGLELQRHLDGSVTLTRESGRRLDIWLTVFPPISALIMLTYFVGWHTAAGWTPGKRAVDICVIDRRTGDRPSLMVASTREGVLRGSDLAIAMLIAFSVVSGGWVWLGSFMSLVVLASILFHPRALGLHDLAAGTMVTPMNTGRVDAGASSVLVGLAAPGATATREVGGRARRFAAALLDSLIVIIPYGLTVLIVAVVYVGPLDGGPGASIAGAAAAEERFDHLMRLALAGIGPVAACYFILCHAIAGGTLAKAMLSLRVIDIGTGRRPSIGASAIRHVVLGGPGIVAAVLTALMSPIMVLSWLAMLCWLAVVAWILFDRQSRGIHDLTSGTVVVRNHRNAAPDRPTNPGW